jgi:hypothetical protein
MKRIILIAVAILLSFSVAEAQQDERYSQGVFTQTTTVTRTKIERPKRKMPERPKYDAKRGFQQQASFGWWWADNDFQDKNYSALRFSYIGGMRFNDYFFAGVGAGLDIGVSNTYKPKVMAWKYDESYQVMYDGSFENDMPMQSIAIPLFVNLKGYFTKTRVAPYLSFSAGARLSTGKKLMVYDAYGNYENQIRYGAFKPFIEVAAGINYRKSADRNYTFQFGYYTHNVKYFYGCDACNLYNRWSHGFSMSVGMTF